MPASETDSAVARLVDFVKTYESDTFSASGEKLTSRQARVIARKIISNVVDSLDGVMLSEYLEDARRR